MKCCIGSLLVGFKVKCRICSLLLGFSEMSYLLTLARFYTETLYLRTFTRLYCRLHFIVISFNMYKLTLVDFDICVHLLGFIVNFILLSYL